MRPSISNTCAFNKDSRSPSEARPYLFSSTGSDLPPPRYITDPHRGLQALYGDPDPAVRCGPSGLTWVNEVTGEMLPARCKRVTCLNSARFDVGRLAAALALAEPEVMVRYHVPDAWPEAQRRINRFHEYLRDGGRRVQVAYAIERNPARTGCHVHALMYGDPVEGLLLSALERAGLSGEHHFQSVTHRGGLGYAMKAGQHNGHSLADHLDLNGGSLLRTTRGFWREGREGAGLRRTKAMQIGWRRLHHPDSRWVLSPAVPPYPAPTSEGRVA